MREDGVRLSRAPRGAPHGKAGELPEAVDERDVVVVRMLDKPFYDAARVAITGPAIADGVKRMLSAAGAVSAGADTFETLRIEAGMPVFGKDIDDNRFVMEVGFAPRAVSYAKGCYLGKNRS